MKSILIVILVSLTLGIVPVVLDIVPAPAVHDEFAYLLQADTFSHARLTNPPLPADIAASFETMHVLVRPTYASKFPPGQGLFLCLGQWLTGRFVFGAILSIALGCGAVTWAMRAAVPARWALAGGLIAATHPLLFQWGDSYWGGGVSLIGGALALGATVRLVAAIARVARPRTRHATVLGVSLAVLANSRPFEGTLLAGVLFTWIAVTAWHVRHALPRQTISIRVRSLLHIGWGMAAVLALVATWDGYYNWRVTGNPLRMPYAEHAAQYMASPLFWWQSVPPNKHYASDVLGVFHGYVERREYEKQTTPIGFLKTLPIKYRSIASEWIRPGLLLLCLPGVWFALRRRSSARWAAAAILLVPTLEFALSPWFRVHYTSVIGGAIFFVIGVALYETFLHRRALGVGVLAVILAGQTTAFAFNIRGLIYSPWFAGIARQRLVDELTPLPGKHLVFIRYVPGRNNLTEWVYNEADLDAAKIVFARSLDAAADRRVLAHFAGRTAWRATVDVDYQLEKQSKR